MKAVFIARTGALVEGCDPRFKLRCGAGAGLRQLTDLDFRVVVIENDAETPLPLLPPQPMPMSMSLSSQPAFAPPVFDPDAFVGLETRTHRRRRSDRWRPAGEPTGLHAGMPAGVSHAMPAGLPAALALEAIRTRSLAHKDDGIAVAFNHDESDNDDTGEPDDDNEGSEASDTSNTSDTSDAEHAAHAYASFRGPGAASAQGGCIADRLGDLLFREQVPLQGWYACIHYGKGALARQRGATPGNTGSTLPAALRAWAAHGKEAADPAGAEAEAEAAASAAAAAAAAAQAHRCACVPPQPGLLLRAAFEEGIELANSWLIGATLDMVEAGNRAGCRTILLDNGTEVEWRLGRGRVPTRIAPDLHAAAVLISAEGIRKRPW